MFNKIITYAKLNWIWILVLLPIALWLFSAADDGIKQANMAINTNVTIQNAIVDDAGVPFPGKTDAFFKAMTDINNAKSKTSYFKPLLYISAGLVCLILILITTTLMGYAFTEFKFLKYIGLFNKSNTLTKAEIEQGHRAFWGMIVILCINALTWIPLTVIYVASIT